MEGLLWFHCSRCYRDADAQQHPVASFHITSCSHLLCATCFREAVVPKNAQECPVCLAACSMLPLNAQIPPDLRKVFMDPTELTQDLLQTYQFQRTHQDRFIVYLRDLVKKQRDILQRARAELLTAKEMHSEMVKLRQENERLQQQLQQQQGQLGGAASIFNSSRSNAGAPAAAVDLHGGSASTSGNNGFLLSSSRQSSSNVFGRLNTPSLQQHQQPPGETDDSRFPARVPSTSRLSTSGGVTSTPLGPNRLTLRTPPMSGRIQPPADSLLSLQQTSTWASTFNSTSAAPRPTTTAAPHRHQQQPQPPQQPQKQQNGSFSHQAAPFVQRTTGSFSSMPQNGDDAMVVQRRRNMFPGSSQGMVFASPIQVRSSQVR